MKKSPKFFLTIFTVLLIKSITSSTTSYTSVRSPPGLKFEGTIDTNINHENLQIMIFWDLTIKIVYGCLIFLMLCCWCRIYTTEDPDV